MKKKSDKYDKAVAYLKKHPDQIKLAWNCPYGNKGGDLFKHCGTGPGFGCLTQIRKRDGEAATPELTKAIRADKRIPTDPDKITVKHLSVFRTWQRRVQKVLRKLEKVR